MKADSLKVSVVAIGNFDPQEFMPAELLARKVVSSKQLSDPHYITLLRGHTVHYRADWLEVNAQGDRLQVTTSTVPFIRLADFVQKVVIDFPSRPRVTAFGINVEAVYDLLTVDARNALGRRLSPPSAWGAWGKAIEATMDGADKGTELQGGMTLVRMREAFRRGPIAGWLDISVTPHTGVQGQFPVQMSSNHHHAVSNLTDSGKQTPEDSTNALIEHLAAVFEESVQKAQDVFLGILAEPAEL